MIVRTEISKVVAFDLRDETEVDFNGERFQLDRVEVTFDHGDWLDPRVQAWGVRLNADGSKRGNAAYREFYLNWQGDAFWADKARGMLS